MNGNAYSAMEFCHLLATKDPSVIRKVLSTINKKIMAFVLRFDSIVTMKPDHKGRSRPYAGCFRQDLFLVVLLVSDTILQTTADYFTLSKWLRYRNKDVIPENQLNLQSGRKKSK